MRKFGYVFYILLLSVVLIGCSSASSDGSESKGEVTEIRLGHPFNEDHSLHEAAVKFKEQVEAETNNAVKVTLFPNAVLGSHADLYEGIQIGSVDMTLIASSIVGSGYGPINLFDLPYLFKDREHAYAVADGEIGQEIKEEARKKLGLKTIAHLESGMRQITNSKHTIRTPDDLNNLKLRIPDSPLNQATFEALGVDGAVMSLDEVYTSLQQGTVDGQDNPVSNVYTMGLYEVQPFLTLTEHQWSGTLFLANDSFFEEKLTDEEKEIVLKAAKEAEQWQREEIVKEEQEIIDILKNEGVEVTELTEDEKDQFRELMIEVQNQFEDQIGAELLTKARGLGSN